MNKDKIKKKKKKERIDIHAQYNKYNVIERKRILKSQWFFKEIKNDKFRMIKRTR